MNFKSVKLYSWQRQALQSPYNHTVFFGGVGIGKTATGAHFIIKNLLEQSDKSGFVGANNYDQLSSTTLKELFYWLDEYNFQYVSDRIPPPEWRATKLKKYHNTVHILNPVTSKATTLFTRVLAKPDKFRGLEFSYYWIDETRDTKEYAHDMILGRMRESDYRKGLVTTTTNGEDWVKKRFTPIPGDYRFGMMHVPSTEAVRVGLHDQGWLDDMLKTYSPLMAEQEIYAKHVNVGAGRAYYSASDKNKARAAPWGDQYPNPERPLIVGCDFNFQPAPCVWVVGQVGPWGHEDQIHWFGEIESVETSTVDMAKKLVNQYPGFFYEIYGDASGTRGTTSNAGQTDYDQIGITLNEHNCLYTIDVEQANPRVKDRIENVNARLKNGLGAIRMTYNPDTCPLLDGDFRIVGWKNRIVQGGMGKLDDMGDKQRTHASDGIGYAVYKKFPPGKQGTLISSLSSSMREDIM